MNIRLISIDIAKTYFSLQAVNKEGRKLFSKTLHRSKLMEFIIQQPSTEIVMESCGAAHYWAREFLSLGHRVRLIAPQHVKAFARYQKNDKNDAAAIAEAALSANVPEVSVKPITSQDIQSVLKVREGYVKRKVALANQIRGLLNEYGVIIPKGNRRLTKLLPEILETQPCQMTPIITKTLARQYQEFLDTDGHIVELERELQVLVKSQEVSTRLKEVPGLGLITIAHILSLVGNPSVFKNGRHFAAYIGLVPRQNTTGGKVKLGRMTKRGDLDLRKCLIHGARSVVFHSNKRIDSYGSWVRKLKVKKGVLKAAVAVANKNARIIWRLLMDVNEVFDSKKAVKDVC